MPRSSRLPALFLVLGALLSACSDDAPPAPDNAPPPPTPQEKTLNGVWQETGGSARVMVLGDGQQLHLLGFEDLQGRHWQADQADTLQLKMLVRSTGTPVEQHPRFDLDNDNGTLTLANDDEAAITGTWQRAPGAAVRLQGRITLPDDFSMPADAVLAITLEEQDADGLPADIIRRQLSRPKAGSDAVDYRFYLTPAMFTEHPGARLTVRVMVDGALQYLGHAADLTGAPQDNLDIALEALNGATSGQRVTNAPLRTLHGEYRYVADAAVFTECASGKRYPVAYSEGGAELERAFLAAERPSAGDGLPQPLLMTVTGTLQDGPGMEEGTVVEQLFVQTLERTMPEGNCANRGTATLENTYWKLTLLGSQRVQTAEHQREAHLVLHGQEKHARGNLGCNQFTGSYELDGDTLTFGPLAATKMACAGGMNIEGDFSAALDRTRRVQLDGETLILLDERGKRLAELQAVYLY